MVEKLIFEILIYRVEKEKFYSTYEKRKKSFMQSWTTPENNEKALFRLENHFFENYGGPWNYNQIIGAIEIYTLGDQIRGELWLTSKKRFNTKMKNKNIIPSGKVFESSAIKDATNDEIFKEIKSSIKSFLKYDKRLIPDFSAFENIGKYVDWKALV